MFIAPTTPSHHEDAFSMRDLHQGLCVSFNNTMTEQQLHYDLHVHVIEYVAWKMKWFVRAQCPPLNLWFQTSIICAPWQWISSIYVNTCTKLMSSMIRHATSSCWHMFSDQYVVFATIILCLTCILILCCGMVVLTMCWRVIVKCGLVKGNT